jgi:hypothetical protein
MDFNLWLLIQDKKIISNTEGRTWFKDRL